MASVADEDERWAAIEDAPFNPRTGTRQWKPDGAQRVVGQRIDRPVTLDEKVAAVADLPRDDEVGVVTELTRDDDTAQEVTRDLLHRPGWPARRCGTTPHRCW
ncbi:DUF6192 family protein [Streptomyces sp. NPDC058308]|uniref:DUF6192 family protein n=1 Tax=Streptomyces sp. NPDC058308 TaxID=3346440 RepID=UPI0036E8E5BF